MLKDELSFNVVSRAGTGAPKYVLALQQALDDMAAIHTASNTPKAKL